MNAIAADFGTKEFTFNGHTLRTKTIDGQPWLVAVDVLRALGIVVDRRRGTAQSLLPLGPEEKCLGSVKNPGKVSRGNPNTTLISESGFYKLTMRAQRTNPAARAFQDWVTKEVLPALRKDGMYVMGEEKVATGEDCTGCPKEAPPRAPPRALEGVPAGNRNGP